MTNTEQREDNLQNKKRGPILFSLLCFSSMNFFCFRLFQSFVCDFAPKIVIIVNLLRFMWLMNMFYVWWTVFFRLFECIFFYCLDKCFRMTFKKTFMTSSTCHTLAKSWILDYIHSQTKRKNVNLSWQTHFRNKLRHRMKFDLRLYSV